MLAFSNIFFSLPKIEILDMHRKAPIITSINFVEQNSGQYGCANDLEENISVFVPLIQLLFSLIFFYIGVTI